MQGVISILTFLLNALMFPFRILAGIGDALGPFVSLVLTVGLAYWLYQML